MVTFALLITSSVGIHPPAEKMFVSLFLESYFSFILLILLGLAAQLVMFALLIISPVGTGNIFRRAISLLSC